MTTWDFARIKQRCVSGLDDNVGRSPIDNGDGNDDNGDEDDAGNGTIQERRGEERRGEERRGL